MSVSVSVTVTDLNLLRGINAVLSKGCLLYYFGTYYVFPYVWPSNLYIILNRWFDTRAVLGIRTLRKFSRWREGSRAVWTVRTLRCGRFVRTLSSISARLKVRRVQSIRFAHVSAGHPELLLTRTLSNAPMFLMMAISPTSESSSLFPY